MYSTKDLNYIIKEHVSKLDLKWFEKKEAEFKRNKQYIGGDQEAINIVDKQSYPNYGEDEEISGYEVVEEIINIDLRTYCSCYLPIAKITFWGDVEYMDNRGHIDPSNNIVEVAYSLVKAIAGFLAEEKDAITTHKFISSIIDKIEAEVAIQKESLIANDIYRNVLDDFLNRCTSILYRKYERQLTIYKNTVDYKDKLIFDLKQDELAALLYILFKADFIFTPTKKYTDSFLDFCESYFHFRNQKEGMSPTPAKGIGKKFSEARSLGYSIKARESVISRLQQAFKDL